MIWPEDSWHHARARGEDWDFTNESIQPTCFETRA